MWTADKLVYRGEDDFVRAYQGSELVWYRDRNKIFYTSTDDQVVTPNDSSGFGSRIVSNTYSGGQGIIVCERPITTIGRSVFNNCSTLESIIIPEGVVDIQSWAFADTSLSSITIPSTVDLIYGEAFQYVKTPVTVTISPYNTRYKDYGTNGIYETVNNRLTLYQGFVNTVIYSDTLDISAGAFRWYDNMTSKLIPQGVNTLENYCFEYTGLVNVSIPSSVSYIGLRAFGDCSSLTEVRVAATVPPSASKYMFENTPSNMIIKVPHSSLQYYLTADGWREYASQIVDM